MQRIHHVFEIAAPRERVYEAITSAAGLASWWTTRVEANPQVGGSIDFTFGGDFNPDMRITELRPPEAVVWEYAGGHDPWAGSTFIFELGQSDKGTRVRFSQTYGRELSDDAFGTYNFNWGYYLDSLVQACETGTGKPYQVGVDQVTPARM